MMPRHGAASDTHHPASIATGRARPVARDFAAAEARSPAACAFRLARCVGCVGVTARDPRAVASIVASALFMQNLDSSVVATALPAMSRDLGADPVHLSVAITSYLVALCVFIRSRAGSRTGSGRGASSWPRSSSSPAASALVGLSQGSAALSGRGCCRASAAR
jgi:hypothetical protein